MIHTTVGEKCARHCSARFLPVAMPSLADRDLDQHGHQVAGDDDPQQGVAELGSARDVGGEIARVDVGYTGDKGRAQEREDAGQAAFFAGAGEDAPGFVDGVLVAGGPGLGWRLMRHLAPLHSEIKRLYTRGCMAHAIHSTPGHGFLKKLSDKPLPWPLPETGRGNKDLRVETP